MRHTAVASDPIALTRALRMEMGMTPEVTTEDTVMVIAPLGDDATLLSRIAGTVERSGDAALVWTLRVPQPLQEPAKLILMTPSAKRAHVQTGLTLWVPAEASGPMLIVSDDGTSAFSVVAGELIRLAAVPLGGEVALAPGRARARDRLSERMRWFGKVRRAEPRAP